MRVQRLAAYVALALGGVMLALWQYFGYQHERALIEETLHQQSHSVMSTLVGGIRSHRRLGCFFEEQLAGMLDEMVKSSDVLAVAVASVQGKPILSAGATEPLGLRPPIARGQFWDSAGFRLVEEFALLPASCPAHPAGGLALGAEGAEDGGAEDQPRCCLANCKNRGPFADGGQFIAVLLLDRQRSDALCRGAVWSHLSVATAGVLVVFCVALVWRASVRLVGARGRARVLETEARHLRELGQAAAGLAHDTRNPLGLVRGWTQRLAESDPNCPQRREQAQAVMEECDRVTARINQFLTFARPCRTQLSPVDPQRVIDQLATILQPDLEAKDLQLKRDVLQPCRAIQADQELLRQALFNLMQNAIYFAPRGDSISIALVPGFNGYCRIEVADRGPGVAEENVQSLFTPYFTTRADGTGLGLAIVRRIAAAHGWEAEYRPRPGGGSVFALDGLHG